jgi:DNA polymerase II small subunit/DNA polymerase delta subunit B
MTAPEVPDTMRFAPPATDAAGVARRLADYVVLGTWPDVPHTGDEPQYGTDALVPGAAGAREQ